MHARPLTPLAVLLTALLASADAAAGAPAALPDAAALPGATYRVVLDDPAVRVLMHKLDAGASDPLHHHPCTANYSLGAWLAENTSGVGVKTPLRRQLRSAWTRPAEDHALRNASTPPVRHVSFEFKTALPGVAGCGPETAPPLPPLSDQHALHKAAGAYKKVLETSAYRLYEFILDAGKSVTPHQLGCGVTFSLGNFKLRTKGADDTVTDVEHLSSTAWWRPAATHTLGNPGPAKAVLLVLEFKQPPAGAPGC